MIRSRRRSTRWGRCRPAGDAVFVFSSGTTGLPKAVRHTHASFAAAVGHWGRALQLGPTDRLQIATPPSHILGLLNIATVLDRGGYPRLHRRFDIDTLLRHIASDRITVEMAVAPIALAIASHPDLESFDLSSLRYIMWCATPVTPSVAETVTRRAGVTWMTAYGASELPVLACNDLEGGRLDTVGRAPGVHLRVVSLETGEPLPAGQPGDSGTIGFGDGRIPAVGGHRGSVRRRLVPDGRRRLPRRRRLPPDHRPHQGNDQGAWLPGGPAEVERVLLGHPAVADCAVFGIPDVTDGEAVVAAVATRADVIASELVALVENSLAGYKRPRDIVFVEEIPRLPSGKVLRRVLKERHGCTSDH
jgi:acyl-CoA synthetase (AMP-forming)/AMP-acid ligase II